MNNLKKWADGLYTYKIPKGISIYNGVTTIKYKRGTEFYLRKNELNKFIRDHKLWTQ